MKINYLLNSQKSFTIPKEIISLEDNNKNQVLLKQVLDYWIHYSHQGSKANKSRSDVVGSQIKPWKQKGTGRARAGTKKSPIWRSGGVTFAASPGLRKLKLNRKMYRKAMAFILASNIRNKSVFIIEDKNKELNDNLKNKKVKELFNWLKANNLEYSLLVDKEYNQAYDLSSRNLPWKAFIKFSDLGPHSFLKAKKIIFTESAIELACKYWSSYSKNNLSVNVKNND